MEQEWIAAPGKRELGLAQHNQVPHLRKLQATFIKVDKTGSCILKRSFRWLTLP